MTVEPRILIIDGYTREARDELVAGGASMAADLYQAMILRLLPSARCDLFFPADSGTDLPDGVGLADYDALAWTGCSLTIFEDIPAVRSQITLAKKAFELGIQFVDRQVVR